jgi:glycosyltransferase involved in cell wall biosynthesis
MRGVESSPWSSLLPLLRTCGKLLWIAARGQVDVAHVNTSSHGSPLRKGVVVRVCRLAHMPVVLYLHASSFPEFFSPLPGWVQRLVRQTFGLAARVIVLGHVWHTYVQDVLAVPPAHVTVLPNAIRVAVAAASGRVQGELPHIVFLGRLGPQKGLPELLWALADRRLRDRPWGATEAGDGDVSGELSVAGG